MKNENIELRTVVTDDREDLWLWRNHPEVRRHFFNRNAISWEEHVRWFDAKVADKNTHLYIATLKKDKIGVIRFEDKRDLVYVSVNLNPRYFGKGLGNIIIKLGTERFKTEKIDAPPIIARIINDNIISQKAFSKAGYIFEKEDASAIFYRYP